jgi:hypothetical protein
MAKGKYNHKRRIKGLQPAKVKAIAPGTILQFKYKGKDIFDDTPLVLVIWNDLLEQKIHGINLNYLTEHSIKIILGKIVEGTGIYSDADFSTGENIITEEDQDDSNYDDNLPYRNILREPYTRVKLPTFREKREGNPLSKAEAQKQIKMLYIKVLKKLVNRYDAYRSYHVSKMVWPKVVRYDIEGLLK